MKEFSGSQYNFNPRMRFEWVFAIFAVLPEYWREYFIRISTCDQKQTLIFPTSQMSFYRSGISLSGFPGVLKIPLEAVVSYLHRIVFPMMREYLFHSRTHWKTSIRRFSLYFTRLWEVDKKTRDTLSQIILPCILNSLPSM